MIAKDGEGATKLIEVEVNGAVTDTEARKIAKTVVGSPLVKTAVFGCDANWGRIIAAVGYSGATIDPNAITIQYRYNNSCGKWRAGSIFGRRFASLFETA